VSRCFFYMCPAFWRGFLCRWVDMSVVFVRWALCVNYIYYRLLRLWCPLREGYTDKNWLAHTCFVTNFYLPVFPVSVSDPNQRYSAFSQHKGIRSVTSVCTFSIRTEPTALWSGTESTLVPFICRHQHAVYTSSGTCILPPRDPADVYTE
jgi:hypothetical protein